MARPSTKLALLLLEQYCGTLVGKTADCLLQHGPCPLRFIIFKTKQPVSQTRTALALLMQHRFCEALADDRGIHQYQLLIERILVILNYCKYPQILGTASSEDGDSPTHFILTNLLQEGQITIKLLVSVYESKYPERTIKPLEDAFCQMFQQKFIECSLNTSPGLESLSTSHSSLVGVATIARCFENAIRSCSEVREDSDDGPSAKRLKEDKEDPLFWALNHTQFKLKLLYNLVLTGLGSYFDDESLESVAKALVNLACLDTEISSEATGTYSIQDIARHCNLTRDKLDDCLKLFEKEVDPLIRSRDILASGGTYYLETKKVLKRMLGDTFAIIVGQKLSSFHARIFRMIRDRGSLPQKLIEEIAMVTPKECKEYVFDLVKGGFIKTRYYSKAQDYVPAKTHFVFTIDLDHLVRKTLQECCQGIYNAMTRRIHETELHKQLIDRKKYVDGQIEILSKEEDSQQQIEDLRSSFTTHDLEVIQKAEESIKKLEVAELHVTETLNLMMSWLSVQKINV